MKKLSQFTVFFILLLTGIASVMLFIFIVINLVNSLNATSILESETYLGFVLNQFCWLLGVLVGGFFLSTILYQCIRIADNTEQTEKKEDENC